MITVGLVRNFFPLRRPTKQNARALLVAGGIGITPLVAMAKTLQKTGRSFELHLAARDAANAPLALFADEPALIPHVRLHLDDATHSQVQTLEGFQDMGKLNAAQILANYQEGDQLYVCGPAPMMSALLATAKSMHWPDSALFSEYFANPLDGERTAFTIELAKRGKTIHVSAAETALEALEKEGLAVDNVCRQGICGACRCKVIRGEINHRDVILADEERHDTITVCVSRGNENGILVLDLSR